MKTRFLLLTSLVFLSIFVSFCPAIYIQWDGDAGTSDWNTAQNWGNNDTIPGPNDKAGFKTATGAVVTTAVPTFQQMTLGGNGGLGILTVQSGAVLNCTNTWAMGQSSNEGGLLVISGGSITVGNWFYVGNAGAGTINMTGGSITITGLFSIAYAATPPAASSGTVNLDGGTITATSTFSMAPSGGTARLNITAGKLIINGNATSTIQTYINNGWIKGYGLASNVRYDYDITTPGKTTVWAIASDKASSPSPVNGATDVSKDTTLSWTAAAGAASHDVYFGTTSPGTFQCNQTATTFDPGTLDFNTTYYWRIDEVNGPCTVTGDVWNFTTTSGQAKDPDPTSGATNVALDKVLSWTAGYGAASHNVYLGTSLDDVNLGGIGDELPADIDDDGIVCWDDLALLCEYWLADATGSQPCVELDGDSIVNFLDYALLAQDWGNSAGPAFKGNQTATIYNPPGNLDFNTTYYWRIDEVNGCDTVKGDVWSFTTQSGKAFGASPASGTSGVAVNPTLSWSAGAGAASHDVYFGTTNPPAFIGNQTAASYAPGTLANSTVYYWRIDEVNGPNTITGDVWNFTTVPLSTTPVYPYLTWRNNPTNSVVVNWWNPDATGDSSVDYGLTNSYGSTATVATVTNYHHVELTGLTPGATYHYRIRSSDGTVGSDNTYTVPVASPASFRFAVYGDPRGTATANEPYYTRHQALCNWILAQNYDFALETGDTVWEGGGANAQGFYTDFFRLESNLSKSKVIMATMGNHEVQPGGQTYIYYDLYTGAFPANGTSGNTGRVYSFNYGNAHFVCLSSYQISASTQATWLATDLATAVADPNIKWIFAFMHYPMYTTSGHSGDSTQLNELTYWLPLFDLYHVDIVFGGHNHVYERSKSLKAGAVVADGNGTVYITTGLGGAEFNSTSPSSLFASLFTNQTLAACVTIDGNSLTVNAITNADNIVRDTFTLSK